MSDRATETQETFEPDPKLLAALVCPVTKGRLIWDKENQELISEKAKLAYPVRNGIPVLLEAEARNLD
ncbi:MAG: Trm112 family protein [bacterium]